jgi:NAD(P)-dependent dehydrogenase (short-subunit alcohol dehydrogenase family)
MAQKKSPKKNVRPPQRQSRQPGKETLMRPKPEYIDKNYRPSGKLKDKVVLITGGDSGIGRAVSAAFACEGAHVVFTYLNEHEDAEATKTIVSSFKRKCLALSGDIGDPDFCEEVVKKTLKTFKKIDILVNNAAEQHPHKDFLDISFKQMEKTFRTNIFAYFYLLHYALPHLKSGASIINTTSVTAYRGSGHLIDYSATKGAIVAFTRSLSANLLKRGIRVNAVAPGPIWTPLIPASFDAKHVAEFGSDSPMGRAGQPREVAPCYVFLASDDGSYISGQVLHPNGGEIING